MNSPCARQLESRARARTLGVRVAVVSEARQYVTASQSHPGTTYTIQGITQLTGNWSNISTNIPGTGNAVSYLTPTRNNTR